MTCYAEALEQCLPRSKGPVAVAVLLEGGEFISDSEPVSLLDKTTCFCSSVRDSSPGPGLWPPWAPLGSQSLAAVRHRQTSEAQAPQ